MAEPQAQAQPVPTSQPKAKKEANAPAPEVKQPQTPAPASAAPPPPAPSGKKSICPISREKFLAGAKALPITLNGIPLSALVHDFSTGSFGWYLNGKVNIEVDGKTLPVQIGCNLTVVGSKEAPKEEAKK